MHQLRKPTGTLNNPHQQQQQKTLKPPAGGDAPTEVDEKLPALLFLITAHTRAGHLSSRDNRLGVSQWSRGDKADATQSLEVSTASTLQNPDGRVETLLHISDPSFPEYGQHQSAKDVATISALDHKVLSSTIENGLKKTGTSNAHTAATACL
ncbi:hypothetical protein QBC42DRAFT_318129 [Cladorrhinum samala]|uniref:Peptidase S53 activation domain-containing protein n=1 Tax=Cladorrhinum samala TaxID=585594 RepID=A0AAV9HV90_9PEZI|nr:hypothetical protein QBC42DRAFT_318129 [Cladorrhinum samala]